MQAILSLIMQLVFGGAAGLGTGKLAGRLSLGQTGDAIVGAVGGIAGTWLAQWIPGLDGLIGGMTAEVGSAGGIDLAALAGQALTGFVGGGVLTALVGYLKNKVVRS